MTDITRRTMLAGGLAALVGGCTAHGRWKVPPGLRIRPGADMFELDGKGRQRVVVHYYLPRAYRSDSPLLFTIPAAGRTGDELRDAWLPFAADKGVFIAAPNYPADAPPFGDFDQLFHIIKKATRSDQSAYDMFGQAAGAEVLQRHLLLHPGSHARRLLAANAGSYTLPDLEQPQPRGLKGLGLDKRSLRLAFSRQLLLLLGEQDAADLVANGREFHAFAAARARTLQADFNWELRVVPSVGPDLRATARMAANILYG